VELYDGGTLGIMVTHKIEEADRVFLIDTSTRPERRRGLPLERTTSC